MPRPLTVAACRAAGRTRSDQRARKATRYPNSYLQKRGNLAQTAVIQATAEITGIGDVASAAARSFGQGGKGSIYFLETGDRVARRTLVSYDGLEFLEIRVHILDRKFVAMQGG
jgi:hypothetical protein